MRLPLTAFAGLALVLVGFTPQSADRAGFDPGNLVVADTSVREQDPTGKIVRAFDTGGIARAAAMAGGTLFVAGKTPTLLQFNPDGTRGMVDSFPDGFEVTAMDGNASHIYAAVSDGRSLHQIYRFTTHGVGDFPFPAESAVSSLDIAADGCSLIYSTLERGIRLLDTCKQGASSVLLLRLAANDIALLPDSTLLVAPRKGNALLRVRSDGKVIRRYTHRSSPSWKEIAVTPDGSGFWAADSHGRIVRFSLSSRAAVNVLPPVGPVNDLVVVGAAQGRLNPNTRGKDDSAAELDGVSTLTGEGFIQQIEGPPLPPEACSPSAESTLHFETRGLSVGPYPGTFASRETALVGPQTVQRPSGPLGVPVGRLLSLDGSFSISGGSREVSGTLSLPRAHTATNTAACLSFRNQTFPNAVIVPPDFPVTGYYRNIHARRFPYEATIAARGLRYVDRGDSGLFTDEYYLTRADGSFLGSATRLQQTFRSRLVSVSDRFASVGTGTEHSVRVRGTRTAVTLRVEWKRKSDAFTVKDIRFRARSSWMPQRDRKLKPGKLKPGGILVRATRKGRTLKIVVTKLKPGEIRFTVVPTRLNGSTTAKTILENPTSGS
jgi:hypothetical protein